MIKRFLESTITGRFDDGKAIIVIGPRQTGKTTLLQTLFSGKSHVLWLNGDDPETMILLENISAARWRHLIAMHTTVIIDEAQRISNIGIKLKLITDQLKGIQLIASGSSAFEMANKINEPLTGRKWEFMLFPLSFGEMVDHHGLLEERRMLPHRLVYGYYPEVINKEGKEKELLRQLTDSYLYKDILMWERIKKPEKLQKLLQALAYQLGNEVSYHELGQTLNLDNQTIENYIRLLEQCFIIFRLQPFSRNLRKELKNKRKIYFYDNGIRNAIIAQYQPLELRQDKGALWENWLISERMKFLHYNGIIANSYFWRTQDQQEIDYIEDRDGIIHAWEFKWSPKVKFSFSKTFTNAYPLNQTAVIHYENFEEFLIDKAKE